MFRVTRLHHHHHTQEGEVVEDHFPSTAGPVEGRRWGTMAATRRQTRLQSDQRTQVPCCWLLAIFALILCSYPLRAVSQGLPFSRGYRQSHTQYGGVPGSSGLTSGNKHGAFNHPPPGSPKNRVSGGGQGVEGGTAATASAGSANPIPELDKPTLLRNRNKIHIKPVRAPNQPNFLPSLPTEQLMATALYPGLGQNFSLTVQLDGNMAITVHPRRGFTTWNITYIDKALMVHPYFNSQIRQKIALKAGEQPVQAMPAEMAPKGRKKRCCIAGALRASSGLDIPNLDAGLAVSLGPGSLTYFKEDVAGGVYNLTTMNRGGGMAEIVVFTTLDPEYSPYPRIHGNDPQIKVTKINNTELTMAWEADIEAKDVSYCFIYHRAQDHFADDVHSSSFAQWMERDTATHLRCVKSGPSAHNTLVIKNLQPGTEYHIDLLTHNINTRRETTFMGVQVTTSSPGAAAPNHQSGHHVGIPSGLLRRPNNYRSRDPPPTYIDNPRRHVFAPPRQYGLLKQPHIPARPGRLQQYHNPANPMGLTAFPPSPDAATEPPPMNIFTPPRRAPAARKPWYYPTLTRLGQGVNRYYAPRQWMRSRLRTYRDVPLLSEPTSDVSAAAAPNSRGNAAAIVGILPLILGTVLMMFP
eukprot:scpid21440/ scgid34449/ 